MHVIYCEPHLDKRHQVEFKWKEKKELARVSPREVTDSWQHPLDPEAARAPERWWRLGVGWKEGETVFVLWDWTPFSNLGQKKKKNSLDLENKKPTTTLERLKIQRTRRSFVFWSVKQRRGSVGSVVSSTPVNGGLLLQTPVMGGKEALEVQWKLNMLSLLFLFLPPRATETSQSRINIATLNYVEQTFPIWLLEVWKRGCLRT